MSAIFKILSFFYIAGIFLLSNSPLVDEVKPFNPYSLLHIPLYGILTILLLFSFGPITQKLADSNIRRNRFLLSGLIAFLMAMGDEIYQAYLPKRNGSLMDLLLDLVGITLVLFLFYKMEKPKHHLTHHAHRET